MFSTSEDREGQYFASLLDTTETNQRGWQSERFCVYPQVLVIEILDGDSEEGCNLSEIQILIHQSNISRKIEVSISNGEKDYLKAKYEKLGDLSFQNCSNEEDGIPNERELRHVHISNVAKFIKFTLHENHPNDLNIFNQVGIIAISFIGLVEANPLTNSDIGMLANPRKSPTKSSKSAILKSKKITASTKGDQYNSLTLDMILGVKVANKLRDLLLVKQKALDCENFRVAQNVKTVEEEVKMMCNQIEGIENDKNQAVEAENFNRASELKEEMERIRILLEKKVLFHIMTINNYVMLYRLLL